MFDLQAPCTETIALWRAVISGAEGACVELTPGTLLVAGIVFVAGVSVLQWIARRLIFGAPKARAAPAPEAKPLRAGQIRAD